MRKSPSFSMGAIPNKYQIDLVFHKLELVLSNPAAKISLIVRIGSQKYENQLKFKALKEIDLQNSTIPFQTLLYENKKGQYQEKTLQIDICLTNSRLSNSIGILKLDLSTYANQNFGSFEKTEYLQLQRSIEYQGKLLLTVKGTLIEKGINSIEETNKREYSDIGANKRSLTPTPKSSARSAFVGAANNVITQKKMAQIMKNQSKSPTRSRSPIGNKELQNGGKNLMPQVENEQITLEKLLKSLKLEKERTENDLKIKNAALNEQEKSMNELIERFQTLQKENESLNQENEEILNNLTKNKEFLRQKQNEIHEESLVSKNKTNENSETNEITQELKNYEAKINEIEKNNEKILMEKLELQIVLQMHRKKESENKKVIETLNETISQKQQEIEVLTKMFNDLQNEYKKRATKEDSRTPLVPTNEQEECEKKCKVLSEKINGKQKELERIRNNIASHQEKWEKRAQEFNLCNKNLQEISNFIEQTSKKISDLQTKKTLLQSNISEVNKTMEEIELTFNDAQQKFFKVKHDLSEIHNVLLEKGQTELIEEIENLRSQGK